jgi:hypothetical protein
MPRVGDLSKCKIYKITSLNNPELVYYGHTCQTLSQRFTSHKKKSNTTKSKQIIEKGDAVILLIENYPCESDEQANAREAFYILNNPCVNKQIPNRPRKEWLKIYLDANKEKKREYDKAYNEANNEQRNEKSKQYYEANKEEIRKRQKQAYEKRMLLKSQLLNNEPQTTIQQIQI